jgi:regulatory protein
VNAGHETDAALRERALQWLAQREHSRQELRDKLLRWISAQQVVAALRAERSVSPPTRLDDGPGQVTGVGHGSEAPGRAADVVDHLLDALEQADHLSQHRFVESRVRTRAQRHGNRRIEHELRCHGLEPPAALRQTLVATEYDRALQVWQRKFGAVATTPAEHARQLRFLAGRGFTAETVRRVLSAAAEQAVGCGGAAC